MNTRLVRPGAVRVRALPPLPGRLTQAGVLLVSVAIAGAALTVSTVSNSDPASAATATTATRRTVLDASWGDTTPVAGNKVLVYGFAFPATEGRVLRVQTASGSAWKNVGSVRSTANGSFTVYLQHTIAGTHTYRLYAPSTATAKAAASPATRFTVSRRATTIRAAMSTRSVVKGGAATIKGTVGPDFTARRVSVYVRRTGSAAWSRVRTVTLNASNRYSIRVPTRTTGSWRYRTHVHRAPYARAATSATVSLRVTGS